MDEETFRTLSDPQIINSTDDPEFNYVSYQSSLAKEWLKQIRKCKCELDETSDDCKHIRRAIKKLLGHRIDKIWNKTLKDGFEAGAKVYGFKVPFSLQKGLSA